MGDSNSKMLQNAVEMAGSNSKLLQIAGETDRTGDPNKIPKRERIISKKKSGPIFFNHRVELARGTWRLLLLDLRPAAEFEVRRNRSYMGFHGVSINGGIPRWM